MGTRHVLVCLLLLTPSCAVDWVRPEATTDVTAALSADVLEVMIGGEPFTTVHFAAEPRPFLYPVLGPEGIPLTRGFPLEKRPDESEDHPHHQSLWYAHGAVNGADFWHSPDARMVLIGEPEVVDLDDGVVVMVSYRWTANDTPVLTEVRTVRFALDGQARTIDFTVRLKATEGDVLLGDTKEGSFALRLHPNLRLEGDVARGAAENSPGLRGKEIWGKRAAWAVYHGPVAGREAGVAVFDHPANLRHPTWWHARAYGLFAANPFGIHDFEGGPEGVGDLHIAAGKSVTFRYRVYMFAGPMRRDAIESAYERFSSS